MKKNILIIHLILVSSLVVISNFARATQLTPPEATGTKVKEELQFGFQKVIGTNANGPVPIFSIDLDGDSRPDVLSASQKDDKIVWYKNLGGGKFSPEKVISTNADSGTSVFAIDLNGDGHIDVLSASWNDDKIAWYENSDKLGGDKFSEEKIINSDAQGATSVFAIDLDADGRPDVISASYWSSEIAWYKNLKEGGFSAKKIINTREKYGSSEFGATSVFVIDLDNDGYPDVLSTSDKADTISWYKNSDKLGVYKFSDEKIISNSADGAESVFAIDLNDDGFVDVISASSKDHKVAWYENLEEDGFSEEKIINNNAYGTESIFAIDLDGDGLPDVLSASVLDHKIAWYKNSDKLGDAKFSSEKVISTDITPHSVFAIDLDGDGRPEVLSTSWESNKVVWYKNKFPSKTKTKNKKK